VAKLLAEVLVGTPGGVTFPFALGDQIQNRLRGLAWGHVGGLCLGERSSRLGMSPALGYELVECLDKKPSQAKPPGVSEGGRRRVEGEAPARAKVGHEVGGCGARYRRHDGLPRPTGGTWLARWQLVTPLGDPNESVVVVRVGL
jgi:hypothetical protein